MAGFHVMAGAHGLELPTVRRISISDLFDALKRGAEDFWAKPSHYVFLGLIYPIVGLILTEWTSGSNAIQLVYPLMTGFALVGPFAAIGLYEMSRRRERGMDTSWKRALDVRHSPALPSIAVIGIMLMAFFLLWLFTAQSIYASSFGDQPPAALGTFVRDLFTTNQGWRLILLGNLTGFVFALGLVFVPISTMAFSTLNPSGLPDATALFTLVRNIGSSIGISAFAVMLTQNTQINHSELSAFINPFNPNLWIANPSAAMGDRTALSQVDGLVNIQAQMVSYVSDFKLMMLVTLSAIPLIFLLKSPKKSAGGAAAPAVHMD